MEKIKALLYCCKNGKKLVDTSKYDFDFPKQKMSWQTLNGKIVAECDFEVVKNEGLVFDCCFNKETQLTLQQMAEYTGINDFYAIHIKNLKERVMELSDVYKYDTLYDNMFGWIAEENEKYIPLNKAPQNMCRVWVYENGEWVMYILISVRPEWLYLELIGEKTVEIRKRVLRGMLK